jgi:hypothetical protein
MKKLIKIVNIMLLLVIVTYIILLVVFFMFSKMGSTPNAFLPIASILTQLWAVIGYSFIPVYVLNRSCLIYISIKSKQTHWLRYTILELIRCVLACVGYAYYLVYIIH